MWLSALASLLLYELRYFAEMFFKLMEKTLKGKTTKHRQKNG